MKMLISLTFSVSHPISKFSAEGYESADIIHECKLLLKVK